MNNRIIEPIIDIVAGFRLQVANCNLQPVTCNRFKLKLIIPLINKLNF